MNNRDFINSVYDILAQNKLAPLEHDNITDLIVEVDSDRNTILFRDEQDKEFELQLVATYAPAPNKDFCHCVSCDKVINLDEDKWTSDSSGTFCENCGCDCSDCKEEEQV